jgi:hypothetical protein
MSKARPSKEYTAFDAMMRDLLTVPKLVLDERVKAHKAKAALNPRKRGPKPKVRPPSEDVSPAVGDES